jgi:hypothetical protein
LENIENNDVFHIRRYDSKGISYLLKSRLPTHPDRERELFKKFPRSKNEKIRGKRWFWTKDAKTILPNEGQPPSNVQRPTSNVMAPSDVILRITLPSSGSDEKLNGTP